MSGSGAGLVEVVRSGFVECVHGGTVLAVDGSGATVVAVGEPDRPFLPRSAAKPLQAVGMLRAGLRLDGPDLALVAASHSGQPVHVRKVLALLSGAGLSPGDLACPPSLPLDEEAARVRLAAGGGPARELMNCSGKHAGMLLTCLARGWPIAGYLDPGHPLQRAVREAVEELTGGPVAAVTVDGCGAPAFATTPAALARSYVALVTAPAGTPERAVADAMRASPYLVGGSGRDVSRLMEGIPGLLAKDGAEGVFGAALPDGAAVVVRVVDGGQRARLPALVGALRALGVAAPVLDELAEVPVLGGGRPVGVVRLRAGALTGDIGGSPAGGRAGPVAEALR